jgi:hypothetical protein
LNDVDWSFVREYKLDGARLCIDKLPAKIQAPVLLAALTAVIALIPFGTLFVWGSIKCSASEEKYCAAVHSGHSYIMPMMLGNR